jgi:two-component system chemotaxis response regulator CheY
MFAADSNFLVVDDSNAVRALVKQQLINLGFKNILEAEDGKEALRKLDGMAKVGVGLDIIIADWNMPEMNGIDLLMNLKNHPKYKSIPFLMITSESETENVIKAIVLGVTDFVVKPFDESILLEKLKAIWKRISEKV